MAEIFEASRNIGGVRSRMETSVCRGDLSSPDLHVFQVFNPPSVLDEPGGPRLHGTAEEDLQRKTSSAQKAPLAPGSPQIAEIFTSSPEETLFGCFNPQHPSLLNVFTLNNKNVHLL